MTPDELAEDIAARSNPRKRKKVYVIVEICREQLARRGSFTLAVIGRLSESRGGPSAKYLRNPAAADYRTIINAYASTSDRGKSVNRLADEDVLGAWVHRLPDASSKATGATLVAQLRRLQAEIDILKRHANAVIDLRPGSTRESDSAKAASGSGIRLSEIELQALEAAVSPDLLVDQGWIAKDNGRVNTLRGKSVYLPGYVTAIKKVLAAQRDSDQPNDKRSVLSEE